MIRHKSQRTHHSLCDLYCSRSQLVRLPIYFGQGEILSHASVPMRSLSLELSLFTKGESNLWKYIYTIQDGSTIGSKTPIPAFIARHLILAWPHTCPSLNMQNLSVAQRQKCRRWLSPTTFMKYPEMRCLSCALHKDFLRPDLGNLRSTSRTFNLFYPTIMA